MHKLVIITLLRLTIDIAKFMILTGGIFTALLIIGTSELGEVTITSAKLYELLKVAAAPSILLTFCKLIFLGPHHTIFFGTFLAFREELKAPQAA